MCILIAKNFITYTRLEILIYLALPLVMVHLVLLRCKETNENALQCFSREDGTIGNNATLNAVFNSLNNVDRPPPIKKILLYTNQDSVANTLKPALINTLKLTGVIRVKKEGDMEKHLVNNNYFAGILWKVKGPDTKVTIRFPSVLRTWPDHLWETDKRKTSPNLPTSYYRDEGFMAIMNAIIAYLIQPDLAKSEKTYDDSGVTLGTRPFIPYEGKVDNRTIDFNRNLLDPIAWKREFILLFYLGLLYIYPFIRLVMHMTREKARQQVDLMNIAGSNRFLHYLSWFITSLVVLTIINLLTVFILKAPFCESGNVLNCSSFTALLFFFTVWAVCGICFCFLVYSLLNNVKCAAFVVAFFLVLAFFLFTFLKKAVLAFCVLFHYAFLTGIKRILDLEKNENSGLQWDHIISPSKSAKPPGPDQKGSSIDFGDILAIMILVAIISLIIALLAELICPGRYGMSILRTRLPVARSESDNCSMIIQAYKLRKWQWRKPPVRNFTMNMYDDQITALLGPSNSGKSTVLNMLSRSYSPDSGWVKIDNNDIRSNLRRSILGLAPQHNALYPNMTVCQHISFYTCLRRSAWRLKLKKRRHQSMEKYLRCLDLWCVRHVKSCSLSRADKKKLAIACAFCGNPRIVLLDQPTEGLEPCERRMVWDLLRSEKRCRTIIIATYHIEEADALADRVGILCDGLLVFNGSAVFLKNCYGSGYQMVLSQGVLYQEPRIAALVSKYAPDTIVASDKDCEMQYNIPQCNCHGIVPLLTCLERPVQCLNINTMQIGTTPIIEKYVNASAPICVGVNRCTNTCRLPEPNGCLLRGWRLCLNQWKAMTLKKFFHIKHNWLVFYILPLLLALAFAGLLSYWFNNKPVHVPKYQNNGPKTWETQEKLLLDLDSYNPPCYYALVKNTGVDHPLLFLIYRLNKDKKCKGEFITEPQLKVPVPLNERYIYAIQTKLMCNYQTWYSRKWLHSEGVAAAMIAFLAYNKLLDIFCLKLKIPGIPKGLIEFYNHPYPAMLDNKDFKAFMTECVECDILCALLLALSIFTGFFMSFVIRERVLGFKLMQKVQGINMATFWLAHLLWDWLFLTLFATILLLIMSVILKTGFDDVMVAYLITLMFLILAQLLFLYLIMLLCRCTMFGWLIPILLLVLLTILFEVGLPDFPFLLLYLIPLYTAIVALNKICTEAEWHRMCNENIKSSYRNCDTQKSIIYSILPYLAILAALAILYFSILLLYERGLPCRRKRCCCETCYGMTRNERRNHVLLLDNVKAECAKRPIKDVSFGLRCMDVLGLVGERSGKTTLNKIIISQHCLSRGRVYVRGINVNTKRKRYKAYKCIGYCPQRNMFEPKFTGRENLKVLGLIRGIKCKEIRCVSEELADNLNFRRNLCRRAKYYNVSDKRKLSVAIAVLGTPPLIILDHPTAGVEKAHRSNVLHVLKSVNECGSAILLSSNNMEDFQYLCNRLALIRRGKLVAIGPVSSYRNHASRGLILMVKARPHALIHQLCIYSINREAIINIIMRYLLANFGSVYLLEEIQGDMLFYIHSSFCPLAKAFQIIEQKRLELSISDFYIKHEDIELSFVTRNFRILR